MKQTTVLLQVGLFFLTLLFSFGEQSIAVQAIEKKPYELSLSVHHTTIEGFWNTKTRLLKSEQDCMVLYVDKLEEETSDLLYRVLEGTGYKWINGSGPFVISKLEPENVDHQENGLAVYLTVDSVKLAILMTSDYSKGNASAITKWISDTIIISQKDGYQSMVLVQNISDDLSEQIFDPDADMKRLRKNEGVRMFISNKLYSRRQDSIWDIMRFSTKCAHGNDFDCRAAKDSLKIATYNAYWLYLHPENIADEKIKADRMTSTDSHFTNVATCINELDADIVVLQEVEDLESAVLLVSKLGGNSSNYAVYMVDDTFGMKVAILSKVAINNEIVKLTKLHGRGVLAKFQVDDQYLAIIGVHLLSNHAEFAHDKRAEDIKYLMDLVGQVRNEGYRVILTGDFNINYEEQGFLLDMLYEQGLYDASLAFYDYKNLITHATKKVAYDYIFMDNKLNSKLERFAIWNGKRQIGNKIGFSLGGDEGPSDHFPITVTLNNFVNPNHSKTLHQKAIDKARQRKMERLSLKNSAYLPEFQYLIQKHSGETSNTSLLIAMMGNFYSRLALGKITIDDMKFFTSMIHEEYKTRSSFEDFMGIISLAALSVVPKDDFAAGKNAKTETDICVQATLGDFKSFEKKVIVIKENTEPTIEDPMTTNVVPVRNTKGNQRKRQKKKPVKKEVTETLIEKVPVFEIEESLSIDELLKKLSLLLSRISKLTHKGTHCYEDVEEVNRILIQLERNNLPLKSSEEWIRKAKSKCAYLLKLHLKKTIQITTRMEGVNAADSIIDILRTWGVEIVGAREKLFGSLIMQLTFVVRNAVCDEVNFEIQMNYFQKICDEFNLFGSDEKVDLISKYLNSLHKIIDEQRDESSISSELEMNFLLGDLYTECVQYIESTGDSLGPFLDISSHQISLSPHKQCFIMEDVFLNSKLQNSLMAMPEHARVHLTTQSNIAGLKRTIVDKVRHTVLREKAVPGLYELPKTFEDLTEGSWFENFSKEFFFIKGTLNHLKQFQEGDFRDFVQYLIRYMVIYFCEGVKTRLDFRDPTFLLAYYKDAQLYKAMLEYFSIDGKDADFKLLRDRTEAMKQVLEELDLPCQVYYFDIEKIIMVNTGSFEGSDLEAASILSGTIVPAPIITNLESIQRKTKGKKRNRKNRN